MRSIGHLSLACTLVLSACQTTGKSGDEACIGGKCDDLGAGEDGVSLCAAVRGNGQRIPRQSILRSASSASISRPSSAAR